MAIRSAYGEKAYGIRISAMNRTQKAEAVFSGDYASVLLYEIDPQTIGIAADPDGDGVYDQKIGQSEILLGDLNADRQLSMADAVLMQQLLTENEEFTAASTNSSRFADIDGDGMIKKGVIVRHLILPAHTRQSIAALELLKRTFGDEILVSLMCQYVPWGEAKRHPKLGRKITRREYDKVKDALFANNIDGFTQDLSSASEEYIPDWDFE